MTNLCFIGSTESVKKMSLQFSKCLDLEWEKRVSEDEIEQSKKHDFTLLEDSFFFSCVRKYFGHDMRLSQLGEIIPQFWDAVLSHGKSLHLHHNNERQLEWTKDLDYNPQQQRH